MVDRFVSVNIALSTSAAPEASYTQMFLVDESSNVPLDRRYLDTTASSYSTDLVSGTNAYKFAQVFFGQKRVADSLRIGRWASAATAPYYVTGTTSSLTLATWVAVTDGTFTVQDNTGTPLEDDITGCNFSTATAVGDIITILNAKLAALTPNITGLDTAEFEYDNFGRLRLVHSQTGAAAKTLTLVSEGTGTDLTGALYFNTTDGFIVAGIDAEEPTEAVTAISEIDDDWYDLAIRGESEAQAKALAAQIESLQNKQLTLVTTAAGCKDPADTTDIAYALNALAYEKTHLIYTEHTITDTGGWVDAAVQGTSLPGVQGLVDWDMEKLTSVYSSGKQADGSQKELTTTEAGALADKNCNYIATAGGSSFETKGRNCSGDEKRIILGVDWLSNSIQTEIFNWNLNQPTKNYDEATLTAYEKIIRRFLTEAFDRKIITDTDARPIVVNLPSADDFTAAQRASGTMTLSLVFSAYKNPSVNVVTVTGEIRV